jgi:hypothetical protein
MKKTKLKTKQYINKNPIEQLLSIGGGVGQAGADLAKSTINIDNWDQYLGLTDTEEKHKKYQGDLAEGQELTLKDLHEKNPPAGGEKAHIEPGINYSREIVHVGEQASISETREIEAQLRELMLEIKKLADSSKELQSQFKEVAIEQHVVKPGKYHKSFFTWMLSVIRTARMKVEDSGAWLAAMQSKKKSREYGAMAKKHGTTFSLSNERVVATQVG